MYNTERSEIAHAIYDEVMTRNEDREERVEMMVDIYDSVDTVRHHDLRTHTEKHQPLQHKGGVSVKNRKQRAAEVCLCLLCFLLLSAVIVLCVCFTSERKQLLTHISNLTEEREQLLTKHEQILNHNNNLTEESEQIFTNNTKLIAEKEHLLKENKILIEEREQIKNKTDELLRGLNEQDQHTENFKWTYYNFTFYYISSERKSWSYSRQDCHQRGADLVIINSKGEQDFLQKIAAIEYFWIGLTKMNGVWKWHDGATVVNGYWSSQYLHSYSSYCALVTSSGWTDGSCTYHRKWVCKKTFFFKNHSLR